MAFKRMPMIWVNILDDRECVHDDIVYLMYPGLQVWVKRHCVFDQSRGVWWIPNEYSALENVATPI